MCVFFAGPGRAGRKSSCHFWDTRESVTLVPVSAVTTILSSTTGKLPPVLSFRGQFASFKAPLPALNPRCSCPATPDGLRRLLLPLQGQVTCLSHTLLKRRLHLEPGSPALKMFRGDRDTWAESQRCPPGASCSLIEKEGWVCGYKESGALNTMHIAEELGAV